MKRILITGQDSYIGTSVENWLMREPDKYSVHTIDMRDGSWKNHDFSQYDVVFHVAGIAHVKETDENRALYYSVNRDLAYETAKMAKESGVKHFIFLSSMSVYGVENGVIDNSTKLTPKTAYGKSKAEAENLLKNLDDESFALSIIRPPMVYGPGCKGNYPKLSKLAVKAPIFPLVDNKRSMIYVDNLSEYVKIIIEKKKSGVLIPQNAEYINTSMMVKLIADENSKKVLMTKMFSGMLKRLKIGPLKKVFGDLVYDIEISDFSNDYQVCSFKESIKITENSKGVIS
ncbi:MAG: NAD-dependent epimerase/dehydratase family protein [Bacteroidales bacterium]|nr:NAD-dependent epimerase/dehydratase family protein [Bacteroidales bacterium]